MCEFSPASWWPKPALVLLASKVRILLRRPRGCSPQKDSQKSAATAVSLARYLSLLQGRKTHWDPVSPLAVTLQPRGNSWALLTPSSRPFIVPIVLASCFSTTMFKWRTKSSKVSQEPKTPRLPSIPLIPDARYAPVPYHQSYDQNQHSNYSQSAPPRQVISSMVDPRYGHREPTSTNPRSRTVSIPTEVKGVLDGWPHHIFSVDLSEAPKAIRPHPSQGWPIPALDHSNRLSRANSTQAHLTPVGGTSLLSLYFDDLSTSFQYRLRLSSKM